jgi:hypothetical protein
MALLSGLSGLFGGNKAKQSTAPNREQRKEEASAKLCVCTLPGKANA